MFIKDVDGISAERLGWDVGGVLVSIIEELSFELLAFWTGKSDLDLGLRVRICRIDVDVGSDALGLIGELHLIMGCGFWEHGVPGILEELPSISAIPEAIGPGAEVRGE